MKRIHHAAVIAQKITKTRRGHADASGTCLVKIATATMKMLAARTYGIDWMTSGR